MDFDIEPLRIVAEQVRGLLTEAVALAPNMIAGALVLIATWGVAAMIASVVGRILRRSRRRRSLIDAVRRLVKILVWIFGLLLAATIMFPGLTPTRLLTGLGIGSIAIGLAFRDIFENFLAGFMILLRRPMRIGDDIVCEGISGQVEAISMRDTSVRQRSGELILLPNSFLFRNPVKILTDRPQRRITLIVGVAYGENVDHARDVIAGALQGLETIADRPAQVFARDFNTSSIDFVVRWWTDSTPVGEHRSRDEVVAAIKAALDTAGIEIPFPYRMLVFKEPLEIGSRADANGTFAD